MHKLILMKSQSLSEVANVSTQCNDQSIELDYIFTGMLKAAQTTANCREQPETVNYHILVMSVTIDNRNI